MLKQNCLPLVWIASACALVAADQKAESPVMAYRYTAETGEVRALLGVPGAARWSDPISGLLPEGTTAVRIAPGHRWALISKGTEESGILLLDTGVYKALSRPIADLDRAIFSPSARSMAVLVDGTATVFTGLPESVTEARQESIGDGVYALSDSGVSALVRDSRVTRGTDDAGPCIDCIFSFGANSDVLVIFSKATGDLVEFTAEGRTIAGGIDTAERLAVTNAGVLLLTREGMRLYDRQTGTLLGEQPLAAVSQKIELLRQRGDVVFATERGGASWMLSASGEVKAIPAVGDRKVEE
ncbi:hypothetical protein F183_A51410 [Bryobacterales bacterium F-183]|nr:hypothetical protein F183_A51410 [Bryobacterales bacterium F-183]